MSVPNSGWTPRGLEHVGYLGVTECVYICVFLYVDLYLYICVYVYVESVQWHSLRPREPSVSGQSVR